MQQAYVIAEIGINHNGSVERACEMMRVAAGCGVDAVKFQKRTIEVVYTPEELARPRASVYGTTNGDLKRGLEFGEAAYDRLAQEARACGLDWSASCWDAGSIGFLMRYDPPWLKVPSAMLTDHALLRGYRDTGKPLYVSTGMSTWEEIDAAVASLAGGGPLTLMHCHSAYPSPVEEVNLACIPAMRARYRRPVGYSSHTVSPWPGVMAVALGAVAVEAHVTLDRTWWGTDQAASLEPKAFAKMVEEIRTCERAYGDGVKRVWPSEEPVRAKLRRHG